MRLQLFTIFLAAVSSVAQHPPDSFQVTDPLDVTHYPSRVIDISNKSRAPICANTYMYDPSPGREKNLIACCATRIDPSSLYTMGSRGQAVWGHTLFY